MKANQPEMFERLYPSVEVSAENNGEEAKEQKKQKKKVKIAEKKEIRVIKLKRGGKKIICNILGFELFGCNLADVAQKMGKKFGSGAAAVLVEHKGLSQDGVQIQGDVQDRLEEFLSKELAKFEIPWECVTFEDGGNYKAK
ncbi:MAG: hypothetical protein ACKO96_32105 [Flammeovirgaceae bacterium]